MEYVDHSDPKPEPISIARCRELLGEDAESMTDEDIERAIAEIKLALKRNVPPR